MNDFDPTLDITHDLHTVTGGGKLGAIWKGAKKAYKVTRPIMKESADFAKDAGILGGVAYGAKKLYDTATGNEPAKK